MSLLFNSGRMEGYLKLKGMTWSRKYFVLHQESSTGPSRLCRYDNDASSEHNENEKSWNISDIRSAIVSVEDKTKCTMVLIFYDKTQKQLAASKAAVCSKWIEEIRSLMPKDDSESSSSREVYKKFPVFLISNLYVSQCGECLMEITATHINLLDVQNFRPFLSWPFSTLRKFGLIGCSKFSFECGRKAPTGVGVFVFSTFVAGTINNTLRIHARANVEATRVWQPGHNPVQQSKSSPIGPVVPRRPVVGHSLSQDSYVQRSPLSAAPTGTSPIGTSPIGAGPIGAAPTALNPLPAIPRPSTPLPAIPRPSTPLPDIPPPAVPPFAAAAEHASRVRTYKDGYIVERGNGEEYYYTESSLAPEFRDYLRKREQNCENCN